MKYKVGDKVRIHSKEWYDKHKDECGNIKGAFFDKERAKFCGTVQTIASTAYVSGSGKIVYAMEDAYEFIGEEAIEGLAEDVNISEFKYAQDEIMKMLLQGAINVPEGYEFRDENGNIIKAKVITLEKKKPKYPQNYEECCKVLNYCCNPSSVKTTHREELIRKFQFLLLARDAYWKIAGEEMGLGKPWTPQDTNTFSIFYDRLTGEIEKQDGYCGANSTLEFPTPEMRDAFYETFKVLIEECKELL